MGENSMAELSRYHIVSCGDEFAVFFLKSCLRISMPKPKLEPPSKDSEPKTEAQTEPSRKRSSTVILDSEEIEEF